MNRKSQPIPSWRPPMGQSYLKYYKQLVGLRVDQVIYNPDGDNGPEFGLKFKPNDGKQAVMAWIMCDEEQNGPGFLSIEDFETGDQLRPK